MDRVKQIFLLLCVYTTISVAQNPVSPPGIYLADPAARVMPDGNLYLYGSNDESPDYYCSDIYHLLSTSDMRNWKITKDIFALNSHNEDGKRTFCMHRTVWSKTGCTYLNKMTR